MFELFMVGTFWFWALIVVEIVLLFMFVEYENGMGATISLVAFAAALQWCGDVDLIGYVFANPIKLGAVIAAYFLLGAIWGTAKWWIFARDRLEEYQELKDEFLRNKGLEPGQTVPSQHRAEWKEKLERNRSHGNYGRTLADTPRVRDNKARILRWMSFWPVSMLWSFLDDFIKRVFKTIYYRIANLLQRISDNMYAKANVAADLEGTEDDNE